MRLFHNRTESVKTQTVIVALTADQHSNSTLGLCPPSVILDDGGEYHPSREQSQLWEWWLDYWGFIGDLKHKHKAQVYAVWDGDLSDGDHHDTPQIISRNKATMLQLCLDVMRPGLGVADKNFVVRGTPVHAGPAAWLEEAIAKEIGAEGETESRHSWFWLLMEAAGVTFDIAHSGPGTYVEWTHGNAANKIAATLIMQYALDMLPRVAVRAHHHRAADSSVNFPIRAIVLPGWQLKTEFVNRFAPASLPDFGGAYAVCRGGEYMLDFRRYRAKRCLPWRAT
jgi:hypothetical protein